jgi:hypothetical protein
MRAHFAITCVLTVGCGSATVTLPDVPSPRDSSVGPRDAARLEDALAEDAASIPDVADAGAADAIGMDAPPMDASAMDAIAADTGVLIVDASAMDAAPGPIDAGPCLASAECVARDPRLPICDQGSCVWPEMQRVLVHDTNGNPSLGTAAGVLAVMNRSGDVKVRYGSWMFGCTELAPTSGGWPYCQAWAPVTLASDAMRISIAEPPDWWIVVFNTTGFTDHARYRADTHQLVENRAETSALEWYARDWREEAYVHTATGGRTRGDLAALIGEIDRGGWATPYGTRSTSMIFSRNRTAVAALDPWHVSIDIGVGGQNYGIQEDAYHFFQWRDTAGLGDVTRWSIGQHRNVGPSTYTLAGSWWLEPGWREVFAHTSTGAPSSGSFSTLLRAIDRGADVRVRIGDVAELCTSISVSLDRSTIRCEVRQTIGHRRGASDEILQVQDTYRLLRNVETTGAVLTEHWLVGSASRIASSSTNEAVRWAVHEGGWEEALGTTALLDAAEAGADLKPVATSSVTGASTHLCHSVYIDRALSRLACLYSAEIAGDASWAFTVSGTDGVERERRVCFGTSTSCGSTDRTPQSLRWMIRR